MESLPKLSYIDMNLQTNDCPTELTSFAEEVGRNLGIAILPEMVNNICVHLSISIVRDI